MTCNPTDYESALRSRPVSVFLENKHFPSCHFIAISADLGRSSCPRVAPADSSPSVQLRLTSELSSMLRT